MNNATVPLHDAANPDLNDLVAADIRSCGVSAARDVLSRDRVIELAALVDTAVEQDQQWLRPDQVAEELGRVVFLPRYGQAFIELLGNDVLMGPCDSVLEPGCILYTMTSLCQAPHASGRPIHVDITDAVPGFIVGLGVMVLLDDWSLDSGPTRFHPDVTVEEPDRDDFEARSLRLEAPAGSVCWFHGRIWHDALPNSTDRWRRAVLLAMVRPYVRQRFDMPRIISRHLEVESINAKVAQKLGFGLVPPGSYEEYFLPAESRREELLRRTIERSQAQLFGDAPESG